MFKKLSKLATVGLILSGLAVLPLWGQPERVYEPFVGTPEYQQAAELLYDTSEPDGRVEEAKQKFAQIATQHPGTTLAAICLLQQAKYSEDVASIPIYHAVIAGYPRSRFEVQARLCILDRQFPGRDRASVEGFIAAADQLAQGYGAPSLQEISLGNNQVRLSKQVRALPLEIQKGLVSVYDEIQAGIANQLHEYGRVVPVDLFVRDTFVQFVGPQASQNVNMHFAAANPGTPPPGSGPFISPTIRLVKPKNKHTGPRPKIVLELRTGPFPTPQVDLSSVKVTLDGQNFLPNLVATTKLEDRRKGGQRSVEQRLRLKGRPPARLSSGSHVLVVEAMAENYLSRGGTGPGRTLTSFSFSVSRNRDEDDDEREDRDDDSWDD